jgi:hypothetical protein
MRRKKLRGARMGGALALAFAGAGLTGVPAAGQEVVMDTAAINALDRMGRYLNGVREMEVSATITIEHVLEDGQKVQNSASADLVAVRPNRLRLAVNGDRHQRLFLYDGKTFVLWAPTLRYYATAAAPESIIQLADTLEERFDIELPLVDLFRWGTPAAPLSDIQGARDLGPAAVGGITCQHYAFRQDGLDWEVWIQKGEHPLPRRLVLNTLTDDARPQYTATYTWNLAPSYNNDSFTFVAPPDARAIAWVEARPVYAPGEQ